MDEWVEMLNSLEGGDPLLEGEGWVISGKTWVFL